MVKLKRLKILKYRNVRSGTELRFDDGVNLVLGQNASGKTTLLALISAVCRGAFHELKREEYELQAEVASELSSVTLILSHRSSSVIASEPGIPEEQWEDRHELLGISPPLPAEVPIGWLPFSGQPREAGVKFTVDFLNAYRFDESLDAFAAMTGRFHEFAGPGSPPAAFAEQRGSRAEGARGSYRYVPPSLVPFVFSDETVASPQPSLTSSEDELCRSVAHAMGLAEISLKPRYEERRIRDDDLSFQSSGFTFEATRSDGTIIHHDRLSYGQKRLLAFIYYLACNPSIVIADELVNGLHHRWIETCMNALGDRQAFLTSQNPLLFDHVEFESVEQVRSRFITCRLEQVDGREQMVWENMSEENAERFFAAYQTGIEYIGDILITRGLW